MQTYLFDTYALIEIAEGNSAYSRYADSTIIVNTFVFSEFCYALIRKYALNHVELLERTRHLFSSIKSLQPELLIEAMQFRFKNRRSDLSMTDCISYLQAQKFGIKFLTGDRQFEKMNNVEFVK